MRTACFNDVTEFTRFAFQTPFFYGQMAVKGVPLYPRTRFGRQILLTCGMLITGCCVGYVVASAWAPLGNANAIGGTFPVGTLVVSRVWLKEPFGYAGLPALVLCAVGVTLISLSAAAASKAAASASAPNLEMLGYAAAAFSAVANSFAYAAVRRAGNAMEPLQYMLLFSVLGLCITLPFVCCDASLRVLSLQVWMGLLPPLAMAVASGALAQMLLGYGSMTPGVTAGLTSLLSSSCRASLQRQHTLRPLPPPPLQPSCAPSSSLCSVLRSSCCGESGFRLVIAHNMHPRQQATSP